MNRKTRVLSGTVLLLVIGVVGYLYLTEQEPIPRAETDPVLAPYMDEIREIKELAKNDPKKAEEKGDALLKLLPEKYRRYYEFGFKAGVGPVALYGQVVDQYGKPVMGARVSFMVLGRFLARGKGFGYVYTDSEGRFEIQGEGAKIELQGVNHPDVSFRFPENAKGARYGSAIARMTFYDTSPSVGETVPLLSDTSKEHPYVFTAWRVEKFEPVKSGYVFGYVEPDGKVATFDLNKGYGKITINRAVDGHLHVSCEREPMEDYGDRVNWKVTLEPVDGGIQPTDDLYLSLAPESGYQPSLTIEMKKSSSDYKERLDKQRYFFTARNGQVYGSLFMYINPHAKLDKCHLEVREFKINSNGSRNLALKPRR